MYTLPICLLVIGLLLLILQVRYFLIFYERKTTTASLLKYMNYLGLVSSLGVAVLSIVYLFILNSQL
ncbi:hypothetical protein [Enterococcus faecium]|uniref:hypothetical protein n=1 Tax=Enterococcus TaxID=1350 RepID=UPI001912BEC4|nr:hypothetical protein [Enterococcus faecium]MBK5028599.1 hypothetical protein [Enterococcus faecium]MBK5039301.1 hypothetical protein [Enterococcus faecium]MBK5044242.1 hypothetical protein [Enterococcus faecium]MBK5069166.1 hypothetical protein [Enterococcus faecium]MBK5132528.1 hypothetical protein [Enterococcus faecium]